MLDNEIKETLDKCIQGEYSIDENDFINVKGFINLSENLLDNDGKLKVKFGEVEGGIQFPRQITDLTGSPRIVTGRCTLFGCCLIKNLIGGPEEVWGTMDCNCCYNLESLKGCPNYVGELSCVCCEKLNDLTDVTKGVKEIVLEKNKFKTKKIVTEMTGLSANKIRLVV